MTTANLKPQFCTEHQSWFIVGFSGRKYWGSTARDVEQNAALYHYK